MYIFIMEVEMHCVIQLSLLLQNTNTAFYDINLETRLRIPTYYFITVMPWCAVICMLVSPPYIVQNIGIDSNQLTDYGDTIILNTWMTNP